MISDESNSRAHYYREIADSLNRLARQTQYQEIRRDLLDLAERFERIAEHAERWQSVDR